MLRVLSTMRTTRSFLNTSDMRSLNTSSCCGSGFAERDRADLPARDRRLGLVLGQPERALDAAGLRARHVAGDAGDLGIVVGVDDDLVVGPDQLEDGVDLADRLGAARSPPPAPPERLSAASSRVFLCRGAARRHVKPGWRSPHLAAPPRRYGTCDCESHRLQGRRIIGVQAVPAAIAIALVLAAR